MSKQVACMTGMTGVKSCQVRRTLFPQNCMIVMCIRKQALLDQMHVALPFATKPVTTVWTRYPRTHSSPLPVSALPSVANRL